MRRRSVRKKADGVRNAQMVIRRGLGWMRGFPCADGSWVAFPARHNTCVMQLGRTDLRRSTFAIGKLTREFPRALPTIVGNVRRWSLLHRSLLAAVKPQVHKGQALLLSALELHPEYSAKARASVRSALRAAPELAAAIDAFTWYCWLAPDVLRPAMKWLEGDIERNVGIVKNYGEREGGILLIRLWELASVHGAKRFAPVCSLLGDRRLNTALTEGAVARANAEGSALGAMTIQHTAERPISKLPSELFLWVQWLVRQDARTIRLSVELFGLLVGGIDLQAWELWWQRLERLIKEGRRLHGTTRLKKSADRKELNSLRGKISSSPGSAPAPFPAHACFALLRSEAMEPNEAQRRAVRHALDVLPVVLADTPMRLAFLAHWSSLRRAAKPQQYNRLTLMISEFASHVEGHADTERALRPWRAIWNHLDSRRTHAYARFTLDSNLLDDMPRNAQVREYYEALSLLQSDPEFFDLDDDDAEELVDVVIATGEPLRAAFAFGEMKRAGLIEAYLPLETLKIAGHLCGEDGASFAALTKELVAVGENFDIHTVAPRLLVYWKSCPIEVLSRCVLEGHLATLCSTVLMCEAIRSVGGRAPHPTLVPRTRAPAWIRRYPQELRAALRELVSLDTNAKVTAARVLAKDLPDPQHLRSQIADLRARIADGDDADADLNGKLETRARKLESWLQSPTVPKPGRLANLAKKLVKAGYSALVASWGADVRQGFGASMPRLLDVETLPEWAMERQTLELLLPIGGLPTEVQTLARELLKDRAGSQPWGLRTKPKNRRFVRAMQEGDIDMHPWLDDAPVLRRVRNGERYTFSLERDPLEVLAMGKHFKTCLAPGHVNYFSAFANAADVNKQVLYGRRDDGTIAARCLLALTAEGGVVTFHPYCHDARIGFSKIVKDYAHTLAAAMGTDVLARGTVPTLVAPSWYDDGTHDFSEQFAFLSNAAFLDMLVQAPLADIVGTIDDALAPRRLDELTLPMVLALDAFSERRDLVLALYSRVLSCERLAPEHILRVAQLLVAADKRHEARRLAPKLVDFAQERHEKEYRYTYGEVVCVLAECAPSQALSVLKKTRSQGIRSWKAETDGRRLHAGALANIRLHRPAQARKLIEQCLNAPCCKRHKEQCLALLASLN